MDKVYLVYNKYQGHHYIASTKEKAQEYLNSKVTTAYGSSWNKDCWSIEEQLIDSKITFTQGE